MNTKPANESLEKLMPDVYRQLLQVGKSLENHFRDVCDIEFVIQDGQLFILNACPAKRTPRANIRFALQFLSEGKIEIRDVLNRVKLTDIEAFINPEINNTKSLSLLGHGLPACAGAATGKIAFCACDAIQLAQQGHKVVLVKDEINPQDIEAIRSSNGVLTVRGGMTSHAALICRSLEKSCIVGFSQLTIKRDNMSMYIAGNCVLKKGDWITLNCVTGDVFSGKGNVTIPKWHDHQELLALASIIETGLLSGDFNHEVIGKIWKIRDFFLHRVPLRHSSTAKRAVTAHQFVSFIQPNPSELEVVRSNLMPIQFEDRENYSQMLFSLADSFSRVLSSALGLGQHHRYYRPLWDPQRCIKRKTVNEGTQLIGFEYFGINRHIPNFVDVSSVAFLIEIELSNESDEWFLDSTNLEGESLVALSYNARAYSLIVNDAVVSYEDFPLLYDSLRRREYFWKFYETNNVSHQDIIDFLPKFQSLKPLQSTLTSLCYELGLIRYGKLTASGESLIGQYRRKLKYEFTKSQ